jgi:hypothetical protein
MLKRRVVMAEAVVLTEEELRAKCAEWQKLLGLQDWVVTLKMKRAHDMPEDCGGTCDHMDSKRVAIVSILDPVDYPPNAWIPHDMERDLVHELLHIHLEHWKTERESLEDFSKERAVHALSEALVNLRRGTSDQPVKE